jgi:hypothetical protein
VLLGVSIFRYLLCRNCRAHETDGLELFDCHTEHVLPCDTRKRSYLKHPASVCTDAVLLVLRLG